MRLSCRLLLFAAAVSVCFLPFVLSVRMVPAGDVREARPFAGSESVAGLMRAGEYDKAVERLREAHELFPYDQSIRAGLTAAYAAAGRQQMERKRYDEAAENFAAARRLDPENRDYGILRGIALYLGKRHGEAAVELEQARGRGEDNVPLLFYLGRVYYDNGDLAGAIEAWDKALALEPGNKNIREMAAKARRESAVEDGMEKGYSSMFVISYDEGTRPDLADAVLEVLETAYNRVGSDLAHYPQVRIPVILYAGKDYRSVTAGPEWSGGLYDGKVRLPVGGTREITPMLRGVLFHEYTHVVVADLSRGSCPTWLNEGLAEVQGRREYDPPTAELDAAAKRGELLSFAELEKPFSSFSAKEAALAYQQSHAMVSFMISAYGLHKVREILVNLADGMGSEAAIAGAFADYGLKYRDIEREWRAHMRKKYGGP